MSTSNTAKMGDPSKIVSLATDRESTQRELFRRLLSDSPIPKNELLANLGLYLNRQTLSRVLFMHELYRQILPVHGVVMEFGTRWGQNAALFANFRGIYEPYNYTRKVIAFDTFEGFTSLAAQDGVSKVIDVGAYGVTADYEKHLSAVLEYHESESPIPHIRKHAIIKGDASKTLPAYLEQHPETIVALAYFDMDVYRPTRDCLEALRPHITKGTVIGFDELNYEPFPGETVAVRETLGLDRYPIRRWPASPTTSYVVIE